MNFKNTIRSILNLLHLDLTKNLEYDRLTKAVLKQVIRPRHNCIDVGCHKGEILEILLRYAPQGRHFAFEPLPHMYDDLRKKFKRKATFFSCALSDTEGHTAFQYVKNAPAYSGIKKRRYDIENPDIEEIRVELRRLDEVIDPATRIDFVKIDVEGAELGVLKGGLQLLKNNRPIVIFECGKGGSDYYGTQPTEIYDFLTREIGLRIGTLRGFLKDKAAVSRAQFSEYFATGAEYYFIAFPPEK